MTSAGVLAATGPVPIVDVDTGDRLVASHSDLPADIIVRSAARKAGQYTSAGRRGRSCWLLAAPGHFVGDVR